MLSIRSANVCVVGGAGFLGSHMVNHLVEDRDCNVLVLDNLCAGKRSHVHEAAEFVHADITCSEGFLRRVFEQRKIQYVFNYAAHPYIPVSFERPSYVFATNATGAINVINAAGDLGVPCLQVSSAELYGDERLGMIDELIPVAPRSSYGASKAAVDFYVQARWREAKVPCVALRQFNCVGERETHPYVVPEIISQLFANGNRVRLGNDSRRDFMYAGDAVRYAVELLESGRYGEVFNLGSETFVQIYDLAQLLSEIVGLGECRIEQDPARVRPWEIWHLQSDNTKIHNTVTYRAKTELSEALERTVDYYKRNNLCWAWERTNG